MGGACRRGTRHALHRPRRASTPCPRAPGERAAGDRRQGVRPRVWAWTALRRLDQRSPRGAPLGLRAAAGGHARHPAHLELARRAGGRGIRVGALTRRRIWRGDWARARRSRSHAAQTGG